MTLAFPKPERPVRGTAECKRHMDAVAAMGCIICGARPVVVHHCISNRYGRSRASDLDTIPLCNLHHDATSPIGIHASKGAWEAAHGPDTDYLDAVRKAVAG